jgi:RNA polymerase sigma-70 factor, ECF subfamily
MAGPRAPLSRVLFRSERRVRVNNAVSLDEASDPRDGEELLLARCRLGDRAALRELYELHVRMVMGMARRLGTPASEMEDVAQEVFAAAFRDLAKVRAGALTVWLFKLTSHRVHDRHRRRRVREAFARLFQGSTAAEVEGPERSLLRQDATRRVERILARMSRKKREVFAMFELEELAGEEIAERLAIPLDTVWTRLFHSRKEFTKIGRALELSELARSSGKGVP